MNISTIVAIGILALSAISSLYKAGKYHAGGEDVIKGDGAAASYFLGFIILTILVIALFFDM